MNTFLIQNLIARLEFMGRTVTTKALNVLPYLPHLDRTRNCNLTTTSPLPHANDCPNEVCPAFPCRYLADSMSLFPAMVIRPRELCNYKKGSSTNSFAGSRRENLQGWHIHSTSHFDTNLCPTSKNSSNTFKRRAEL